MWSAAAPTNHTQAGTSDAVVQTPCITIPVVFLLQVQRLSYHCRLPPATCCSMARKPKLTFQTQTRQGLGLDRLLQGLMVLARHCGAQRLLPALCKNAGQCLGRAVKQAQPVCYVPRLATRSGTYVDGLDLLLRQNIKCIWVVSEAVCAPPWICARASLEENVRTPLHLLRSCALFCACCAAFTLCCLQSQAHSHRQAATFRLS